MNQRENTASKKTELPRKELMGRLARTPDGTTGEIVDVEEHDGHRRVVLDPFGDGYGLNIALERVEVGK